MADVVLSSLKGTSGLVRLAPDLTFPSTTVSTQNYKDVVINPAGSLTTALSLTGKYVINTLQFLNMTAETVTIKLTVDGVVIWNSTFTSGISKYLSGVNASGGALGDVFGCNSSLLLEIQTATDTSVTLRYLARPIL